MHRNLTVSRIRTVYRIVSDGDYQRTPELRTSMPTVIRACHVVSSLPTVHYMLKRFNVDMQFLLLDGRMLGFFQKLSIVHHTATDVLAAASTEILIPVGTPLKCPRSP